MTEYSNGLEKSAADQQRTLDDPYGDRAGFDLTSAQQTNRNRRDEERRVEPPPRTDNGVAWFMVMALLPWIVLFLAMVYGINIVARHAMPYRTFLNSVVPEGTDPLVVAGIAAGVLLAVIIGLFLLRRMVGTAWARGRTPAVVAWLMVLPTSAVTVAVMILTPGIVLVTHAIADGRIGGGAALRSWPLTLSAIGILWWSIGTTRRSVRRATNRRYRDWWQGPDGYWYPPDFVWADHQLDPADSFRPPCTPPAPAAWQQPPPGSIAM